MKEIKTPLRISDENGAMAIVESDGGMLLELGRIWVQEDKPNNAMQIAKEITQAVNTYDARETLIKELKEALESMKSGLKWMAKRRALSNTENSCLETITAALSSANKQI